MILLELRAELAAFIHGTLFLLERKTDMQTDYPDVSIWQTFSPK